MDIGACRLQILANVYSCCPACSLIWVVEDCLPNGSKDSAPFLSPDSAELEGLPRSQKALLCPSGSLISRKKQVGNSFSTVGMNVGTLHARLSSS